MSARKQFASDALSTGKKVREKTTGLEQRATKLEQYHQQNRALVGELTDIKLIENHTWDELNGKVKAASDREDPIAFKSALETLTRYHHSSQFLKSAYDLLGLHARALAKWDKRLTELNSKPELTAFAQLETTLQHPDSPRPQPDKRANVNLGDDISDDDVESALREATESAKEFKQITATHAQSQRYITTALLGGKQDTSKVKTVRAKVDALTAQARIDLQQLATENGRTVQDTDAVAEQLERYTDRFEKSHKTPQKEAEKEPEKDPSCCSAAWWSSIFCCPTSSFKPLDADDAGITMEELRTRESYSSKTKYVQF